MKLKTFFSFVLLAVVSLLLILTLGGCCKKTVAPIAGTVTTDSIITDRTIVPRDTTIFTPAVGVGMVIPLAEIKSGLKPIETKNKQASVKVTLEGKSLNIDCNCDTLAIRATLYDMYESSLRKQQTINTIVREVKYIPLVVKLLAWIGGAALLAIGFLLIRKFL